MADDKGHAGLRKWALDLCEWTQKMTAWSEAVREDILRLEGVTGLPEGDPGDPPQPPPCLDSEIYQEPPCDEEEPEDPE